MALQRVGWENGTLVEPAKVLSDNTVQPAQYEGTTPLSAANLKKMEDNTENFVNEQIGDLSNLETSDKTSLVNAINSLIRWKHHATFTGKTQYTLPKDFNELLIVGKNAGSDFFEIMVPKELLTENVRYFNVGGRYTSGDRGAGMVAQITLSFYKLDYFYEGGKEFPDYNDFTNYIYYR